MDERGLEDIFKLHLLCVLLSVLEKKNLDLDMDLKFFLHAPGQFVQI